MRFVSPSTNQGRHVWHCHSTISSQTAETRNRTGRHGQAETKELGGKED